MRDYKNVTVPRKYRTASNRTTVTRRLDTGTLTRKQAGKPRNLKSVALNVMVLALIAGMSWLGWEAYRSITHSESFQISGVDVNGVNHLGEAEIKKIVGPFTGVNIFRADLDAAVRRACANPWVKSVRIDRRLPNRISMNVTERTPYAILDNGSGIFLMDNEGVLIERLTREQAQGWKLPSVLAKDYRSRSGDPLSSDAIGEALKLFGEISSRGGWKLEDVSIRANTPEMLSILYANYEFKLGSGNYSEKLRRLAEVMEDVKRRNLNIAYVDLRAERQVAVMINKSGSKGPVARGKKK